MNVVAAVVGAGFAFLLFRRSLGLGAARFLLLALCLNPLYWRTAVEAGTDMPAFALSIAATYFALESTGARGALAAGALAGFAILCRYNAAFLVPAGLVAVFFAAADPRQRTRRLLAYAAGVVAVVGPWLVVNQRLTGSAFTNRNYANLAYELYGKGMGWDVFWADVAPRFSSFVEVLRYDPVGALRHWIRNLATRWLSDIRELVPVWLGVAAVLGAITGAVGRARDVRSVGPLLLHFVLCYATLALVFYTPRFFLYLVPFYLAAAALAFFPKASWAKRFRPILVGAAALALVGSGIATVFAMRSLLADAPYEIRVAGRKLHPLARPGDRLLARKPQVAWFAGMEFVPLPNVETTRELLAESRRLGAQYLFLSGIEASLRPQFSLLNEAEVALPGFERLGHEAMDPLHFYTIYRISADTTGDAGFSDSLLAALRSMAQRHSGSADLQTYVGAMLIDERKYDEALVCLERAIALAPSAVQPVGFRALARVELGQLDGAAADCEWVIARMSRPSAPFHLLLGTVRARQDRLEEAERAFANAATIEPANPAAQFDLGLARLARGDEAGATEPLDRAVLLLPELGPVRGAALALSRSGKRDRDRLLVSLIDLVRRTGGGSGKIASLADSLAH